MVLEKSHRHSMGSERSTRQTCWSRNACEELVPSSLTDQISGTELGWSCYSAKSRHANSKLIVPELCFWKSCLNIPNPKQSTAGQNHPPTHHIFLKTQQHKPKRNRSRQSLHKQDLLVGSGTSVDSSNDNTAQEERLELCSYTCVRMKSSPEKSRSQETVVEALVGSHSLSLRGKLRRQVESLASAGRGPEEHLEGQDVDVFESYEGGAGEG